MSPRRRQASEQQLASLAKARAALAMKHTCERCGCEDPARGLQKDSDYRIYDTLRNGEKHRYCISCRIYFRWIDARQEIEAQLQALFDQRTPFLLLDTETTGKLSFVEYHGALLSVSGGADSTWNQHQPCITRKLALPHNVARSFPTLFLRKYASVKCPFCHVSCHFSERKTLEQPPKGSP